MSKRKGGFTLPGEAGYEKLTLELADKWGADDITQGRIRQYNDDHAYGGFF